MVGFYYQSVPDLPEPKPDENQMFLTVDELINLVSFNYRTPGKEIEKRVFFIQYLLGARDSDIRPLSQSLSFINEETQRIYIPSQKQKQIINVPLPDKFMEIYQYFKPLGKIPMSSNQNRNDILKEMAVRAKIDREILVSVFSVKSNSLEVKSVKIAKLITTHWARSSFITHMASMGVPNLIVQMVTNQSDNTLRKYQKKNVEMIGDKLTKELNSLFPKALQESPQ
jgi:hypothetical protein